MTEVDSSSVGAGQVRSVVVLCPAGRSAVGGGIDAADRTGLRLVGSGPVLPGAPFPTRITDFASGATAGAPIGWRVAVRSDAATTRSLKVAAICAPEPEAGTLGATAAAALAWAARRRGSRGSP